MSATEAEKEYSEQLNQGVNLVSCGADRLFFQDLIVGMIVQLVNVS